MSHLYGWISVCPPLQSLIEGGLASLGVLKSLLRSLQKDCAEEELFSSRTTVFLCLNRLRLRLREPYGGGLVGSKHSRAISAQDDNNWQL